VAGPDVISCSGCAQVDQDQQGLLTAVQLPPGRPDRDQVLADDPGYKVRTLHDSGSGSAVDSMEALVVKLVLVGCLSYQGFLSLSGYTPHGRHLATFRSGRLDQDE
jgi:hypothetical protein